jgi:hypothetical protein
VPFHRLHGLKQMRLVLSDGWNTDVMAVQVADGGTLPRTGPVIARKVNDHLLWAEVDGSRLSHRWASRTVKHVAIDHRLRIESGSGDIQLHGGFSPPESGDTPADLVETRTVLPEGEVDGNDHV